MVVRALNIKLNNATLYHKGPLGRGDIPRGPNSRVQKENPRASAFDSGWREGRERRGRSSFLAEEPKDPMLTLAVAVVELE